MQALLIDNYDSFTYNLFQLWTSVAGRPPRIIHNDDWATWDSIDLTTLGALLISPGPGRPGRNADFGISRAALTTGRPVLGVCLGHQGLCLAEGASIVPSPQPVHGRTSPISHQGTGLFTGLPSPFNAVRYHSLIATDIPGSIEVTASTPGPGNSPDLVMAVRHRTKPHWGVQFHPESIATEHGHQLLANFRDLAMAATAVHIRPSSTPSGSSAAIPVTGSQARPTLRTPPRRADSLRLLSRRIDAEPETAALYASLFAADQHGYWLDGEAVHPPSSRFSIMGGGGPLSEWVTASATADHVLVEPVTGMPYAAAGDIFDYLKAQLRARAISAPELPLDFALGYVGCLGYELKANCGGDAAHPSPLPDAGLLFSDRGVLIDHLLGQTWLLALADETAEPAQRQWLDAAEAETELCRVSEDLATLGTPAGRPLPPVRYRHSPERYLELVRLCQKEIRAGESYEINLTNELTVDVAVDPLATFRELRRSSPAPYSALLRIGDAHVLSASPERMLSITSAGQIQAEPIKGTRRRGQNRLEDVAFADELAHSVKDRAENLMIVDLLRNDLGMVAEPGTVKVRRLFGVEAFSAVHQMVSTIEAKLRSDLSPVDCVRAAFPGGSMTGAPKRRTMQILDRLEGGARGVYSGALGYFSLTGAVDLSIVIRTLVVRPGHVTIGSGGAITVLSDPAAEVEEMLLKADAPLRAVGAALRAPTTTDAVNQQL